MKNNNKTIVDLSKVSYANFYYQTHSLGRTYQRTTKPTQPTVNGHEFECEVKRTFIIQNIESKELKFVTKQGDETVLQYATRRGLLDTWIPTLSLQLSNSHSLIYTGDKAIAIYAEWCKRIFNKNKKKN